VLPLLVVGVELGADAGLGIGDAGIGVKVDLLVFKAAPQPLDKEPALSHAAPNLRSRRPVDTWTIGFADRLRLRPHPHRHNR
jgi:hypothetical protein